MIMTDKTDNKLGILTPADRTTLEELGSDIEKSQKGLDLLKELGVGVGELESQLNWAKKRREILLNRG